MSPHRCQICGRRKALTKADVVVMHHVAGRRCPGAGFVPIEVSYAQLEAVARSMAIDAERIYAAIVAGDRRHAELRTNTPLDPQRYAPYLYASKEARRLETRLNRWRTREARRARHMALHGWSGFD